MGCCGCASPMTASAARIPARAAVCPASPGGYAAWTAGSTSPARRVARPGSPSSCRCARESIPAMRVVIAEDAALMREALIAAVAEHQPDVAVVDIRMPPTHTDEGLRAALVLRRDHPGTGILVLSQ